MSKPAEDHAERFFARALLAEMAGDRGAANQLLMAAQDLDESAARNA